MGLVCLLVLSSVVSSYRRIKWDNVRPEEVAREFGQASFVDWVSGAWGEPMRRFHGFDSMLLTVELVPALEPYSGRNVLVAPFLRGFVPRFVYSGKGAADAGMNFGARIWAFDDPTAREQSGASIAPSMPGDLYRRGRRALHCAGRVDLGSFAGIGGWMEGASAGILRSRDHGAGRDPVRHVGGAGLRQFLSYVYSDIAGFRRCRPHRLGPPPQTLTLR